MFVPRTVHAALTVALQRLEPIIDLSAVETNLHKVLILPSLLESVRILLIYVGEERVHLDAR